MNAKSNYLLFLPRPSVCDSSNYIKKIRISVSRLDDSQMTDFQKDFLHMILEKFCSASDFQEYSYFRKCLSRFDEKELEFSSITILKLFQASSDDICLTLKIISQNVDYYPEMNRIYIQEDKKYQITPKQIQVFDCYDMFRMLINKFSSFIYNEAMRLIHSINEEDFLELYNSLVGILKNGTEEQRSSLLLPFDQEFSFLKDTLYCDLYENYKDRYGLLLLKCILNQHRQFITKKKRKEDIEYRTYIMHSFACQPQLDYNHGAYKVYKKRGKNHEILPN